MSEIKWIKLCVTMFDDEKIDFIESLPDRDAILVVWIKLLTLAGKCNCNGYLMLTEKIPYTDETLSHKFKRPLNTVRLALDTFEKLGMLELDEGKFYLSNWEKHQSTEKMEAIREYHRLAKRKQRKQGVLLPDGNGKEVVKDLSRTNLGSPTIDIDIDKDIDKEEDKDNILIMSISQEEYIKTLKNIKNYPLDLDVDINYYNILEERYPRLDLVEAIKKFAAYKLDKPLTKKSNPRSQVNTSFKKYIEWGQCLKDINNNSKKQDFNTEKRDLSYLVE